MHYTVTITSTTTTIRHECNHIIGALNLVQRIGGHHINVHELLTDVAQLGEWLECINNVWFRVTACHMH